MPKLNKLKLKLNEHPTTIREASKDSVRIQPLNLLKPVKSNSKYVNLKITLAHILNNNFHAKTTRIETLKYDHILNPGKKTANRIDLSGTVRKLYSLPVNSPRGHPGGPFFTLSGLIYLRFLLYTFAVSPSFSVFLHNPRLFLLQNEGWPGVRRRRRQPNEGSKLLVERKTG